jgi:UDP-glucose 4-epimerase
MKLLITGGLGFIGGRLARRLAEEHEVIVSSRETPPASLLKLHGPVQAVERRQLLTANGFPKGLDSVIHLAALNEWDSVKYPSEAIRVNIDETRILLEQSIQAGVGQFIYFSTAHVYGAPLQGRLTEESPTTPTHPYAITHRAAEDFVIAAGLQKKINGLVLRLSNAFGAPVSPSVNRWTLLANDLCRQAVEKNALTLLSDGSQYRDFICLADVEEVIARMVSGNHPLSKIIYNLGSGISMRVADMARLIAGLSVTVLRKSIPVNFPANSGPSPGSPELFFSVDRLLSEGFTLPNDVTLELERLLEYCAENFSIHA